MTWSGPGEGSLPSGHDLVLSRGGGGVVYLLDRTLGPVRQGGVYLLDMTWFYPGRGGAPVRIGYPIPLDPDRDTPSRQDRGTPPSSQDYSTPLVVTQEDFLVYGKINCNSQLFEEITLV